MIRSLGVPRGMGVGARHNRGQTPVIAIAILFGVVAIGALGVFLVGAQSVADAQHTAEQERIEQSFVELSHQLATAAANDEISHSMDFEAGQSGAVTKTEAGEITITGGDVDETLQMGAIEYEDQDGNVVAYQGGGVWAERGHETRIVSSPGLSYDPDQEMLVLPIATLSGEESIASGTIEIAHNRTDPVREATLVKNDTVTLEITSEYYLGWKQYFDTRVGDGAVQDVDHDDQYVRVELGHKNIESAFENAATVGTGEAPGVNQPEDQTEGEYIDGESMPPMDSMIEELVDDDDLEDVGTVTNGELTSGEYIADEISTSDDVTVDLEDGDVTLVVDGDIDIGDDWTVENYEDGNTLRIYTTGDTVIGGAMVVGDDSEVDAEHQQLYGKSDSTVTLDVGAGTYYEGLIYVATGEDGFDGTNDGLGGCDGQVCIGNNAEIHGSVVAGSVEFNDMGNNQLFHDEDLLAENVEAYPGTYVLPPDLTYLNLAVYELDVSNAD